MSALDGAAQVLRETGTPMNCKALIATMHEQGLWRSPKGKTPPREREQELIDAARRQVHGRPTDAISCNRHFAQMRSSGSSSATKMLVGSADFSVAWSLQFTFP